MFRTQLEGYINHLISIREATVVHSSASLRTRSEEYLWEQHKQSGGRSAKLELLRRAKLLKILGLQGYRVWRRDELVS